MKHARMICLAILAVAISYGCSQVQDSSVEASNGATEEALIHTTAEVSNSTTAEASNGTTKEASNKKTVDRDVLAKGKPFQFTIRTEFERKISLDDEEVSEEPGDEIVIDIAINKNEGQYPVLYDLDCESDGEYEFTGLKDDRTCVYKKNSGTHTISVRGEIPALFLCTREHSKRAKSSCYSIYACDITNNQNAIISIDSWGDIAWKSMEAFAAECWNLDSIPAEAPDLHQVQNMSYMFDDAKSFNQPIGNWDVSHVTDMKHMFRGAKSFNQPLDKWDVSHVTDMGWMFTGAQSFNQTLDKWDVSNVTEMNNMFERASSFNQPIGNWNVSKVEKMTEMFMDAISFNQPIEKWNVSKVWDMRGMFAGAKSFNQPIGSWDVSHVDSMSKMFENAESFNQPIGNWDVSRVTSMLAMFKGAKSFNQPIENWSMASVETTVDMFRRAESFRMVKPLWPVLRAEDPTFHGSYMPTAVVLYNSIRACYAREAIHDRELAGRVVMQCVISSDGSVSKIMVKESTLKNETVEDCIKKEISNRKFPASKDVTVEFPLEFTMRREY